MSQGETYPDANAIPVPQLCGACRWWARRSINADGLLPGGTQSECRRHAPTAPVRAEYLTAYRIFPLTAWDDNCGDYELGQISDAVRGEMMGRAP